MVKITVKPLKGANIEVEIGDEGKVKDLKAKVQEVKGEEYAADAQKLIYRGNILKDEDELKTVNIEVGQFVVVMVTKAVTATAKVAPKADVPAMPSTVPAAVAAAVPVPVPAAASQLPPELEALRDNRDVVEAAAMAARNPALLEPLLRGLAHTDREIFQLIRRHCRSPHALEHLLHELSGIQVGNGSIMGARAEDRLSQEERAAVGRVADLVSCPRRLALLYFLDAGKNEELATNLLLEERAKGALGRAARPSVPSASGAADGGAIGRAA